MTANETLTKLHTEAEQKMRSLYYWVRLFLDYGEEHRPDMARIVSEIQNLQDRMTELEQSLAEEVVQ